MAAPPTLMRAALALATAVATFWAASAFSTAAGAYLAFEWKMATDEVAAELAARASAPEEPTTAPTKAGSVRSPTRIAADITRHNAFCPTCTLPARSSPATVSPFSGRGHRALGTLVTGEQPTSLPIELVATIIVGDGRDLATLRHDETGVVGIYEVGDSVAPGVRVRRVERGLVHLQNGSAQEYVSLVEHARPPKRGKRKKTSAKKRRKPAKHELAGARQAIACSGKRTCRINRSFVDKLFANPGLLRRQGRYRPVAGRGFRLSRVRKNTIPWLLALRNGDVVTTINGQRLDSMDAAMAVYRDGRRASRLTVEVLRKGKPLTFEYQIQ